MSITWRGQSIQPFAICRASRNIDSSKPAWLLGIVLTLFFLGLCAVRADGPQLPLARDASLGNNVSPYVTKYANDLIFWHALTPQSLELARKLNRPLLMSSGYLSCYWCHRMAEDTFSNPALAKFINDHFLPVIMDREVHIEEDRSLQSFMQDTQGISGWPAVVIMTPLGYPVFGYTYTDPDSLKSSLHEFIDNWNRSASNIADSAYIDSQERRKNRSQGDAPIEGLSSLELLQLFLVQANAATDFVYGGFGADAKFPFVPQMNTLIELSALNPDAEVMGFIRLTLNSMLDSALIDPIEGGVFRYSETRAWNKPHFEQMLYNQALVSKMLLRASAVLKNERYREAGLDMLDHIVQNFKLDSGWYASSLSAVSPDGVDGGYYLWNSEQLENVLGADWMESVENRLPDEQYILPAPIAEAPGVLMSLLEHRNVRPRQRDDKPVLSWNGLVLSTMAYGAALDDRFVDEAEALANLLMREVGNDSLSMIAGDHETGLSALGTHVRLAGGLFDWWQVSGDPDVLARAVDMLIESAGRFREQGRWMEAEALLPEAGMGTIAIPDRQIPSASGQWYRLAVLMRSVDPELTEPVAETMREMEVVQSQAMRDEAFYHATFILARLLKRLSEQS